MSNQLAKQESSQILDIFHQEQIFQKFQELLGERTIHYLASVSIVMQNNKRLQECSSESLVTAVLQGVSLDLSFDPALAEAYMLPFKGMAKFLPGYKGLIQLALRTGQFIELDAKVVTNRMFRELRDQLANSDDPHQTIIRFFSSIDFYPELHGGQIYGYVAYFRLKNGFARVVYWDKDRCLNHAQRYSPSYKNGKFISNSAWLTAEDAMCLKTVIRQVLTFAPKSKELKGIIETENIYTVQIQDQTAIPNNIPKREGHEDEDLFGADSESKQDNNEAKIRMLQGKCNAEAQRLKGLNPDRAEDYFNADNSEWTLKQWEGALKGLQEAIIKAQKTTAEKALTEDQENVKKRIEEIIHYWDEEDYHREHRWNSLQKFFEDDGLKTQFHDPEECLVAIALSDLSLYYEYLIEKERETS